MKSRFNFLILFIVALSVSAISFLVPINFLHAQENNQFGLEQFENTGLGNNDIRDTIASIINISLGFLGTITLLLILYGGFLIMMSAGNAEQVQKGKTLLKNAVIGLIIVLSAWGIATFIIRMISGATEGGNQGGRPNIPGPSFPPVSSIDAIKSHFPARDAVNVPRNTKIIVTFNEKIDPATVIDQGDPNDLTDDIALNDRIKIRRSDDHPVNGPFVDDIFVALAADGKTFVFDPKPLLGNSVSPTKYTVQIGGQIKNMRGELVFANTGDYSWEFEVSTVIDNTPPKVVNVIPRKSEPLSEEPRNVVVQMVFDEAIDPTSASGVVTVSNNGVKDNSVRQGNTLEGFNNITLSFQDNNQTIYFEGAYTISNQYRTVEFVTNDLCGINSCGEDIYCMPGNKIIDAVIKAATVSSEPPQAQTFPFDGIVDVAGNSLDGNGDGQAVGPLGDSTAEPPLPSDNYTWSFRTTNEIDLTPPVIIYTPDYPVNGLVPGRYAIEVPLGERFSPASSPVAATFSKPLLHQSLNRQTARLNGIDYWVEAFPVSDQQTDVVLMHPPFADDTVYEAQMYSGIRDIYQNCYYDKTRQNIFNGCVGPTDENQANDKQLDLRQKTDLLYISKGLQEYYDNNQTYAVADTGLNGSGMGRVSANSSFDSRYSATSVIDKLAEDGYINKERLSFSGNEADYELFVCAQGRTFSLSTKLSHPDLEIKDEGFLFSIETSPYTDELNDEIISENLLNKFNNDNNVNLANNALVSAKKKNQEWLIEDLGNEQKFVLVKKGEVILVSEANFVNFRDEVCANNLISNKNNYAVTNFDTSTITGLKERRDRIRKDDLSNLKGLLEEYKKNNASYPGDENSCSLVSSLVSPLSEYGQVYLDPVNTSKEVNDYLYYKIDNDNYALFAVLENVNDGQYSSIKLNACPNQPVYSYCVGSCRLVESE